MDNKLVMISIAAVIGIIVLGSVLMPILDDATATTDKFTNDGYYDVRYIETEDITIEWEYATPNVIKVGDETVNLPADAPVSSRRTIIASDNFIIRFYRDSPTNPVFQYSDVTPSTLYMSPGDEKDFTITCSNGTMTLTFGTTTKTQSYTYLYVIDNNGPYVMKQSDKAAYVNGDSQLVGIGITSIGGSNKTLYIDGTIDDGATITSWDTSLTFSDIVINYTEVEDHKDLYLVSNITAKSGATDITYSYFMVPVEVTAERSVHFTDEQNAIFAAMPVLIILAVLLGVVALVIRSRMD